MPIPAVLVAGDTWSWTESLQAYPAPTWTLSYALRAFGLAAIDVTSSPAGSDHAVSVAIAVTAPYSAGAYEFAAYVTDGTERHQVASGAVKIAPNLAVATNATDNRTPARKMLDAIRVAVQALTAREVSEVTIAGRTIRYADLSKLIAEMRKLEREVATEEAIASGRPIPGQKILTRFV